MASAARREGGAISLRQYGRFLLLFFLEFLGADFGFLLRGRTSDADAVPLPLLSQVGRRHMGLIPLVAKPAGNLLRVRFLPAQTDLNHVPFGDRLRSGWRALTP